jgi:hypothetical protein
MDLQKDYVCGLCNVPSRAGKTRKRAIPEKVAAGAHRRAPTGAPGEFLLQAIMTPAPTLRQAAHAD